MLGLGLHEGLRLAAALVLLVSGVSAAPLAFLRWARAERALREGKPLPTSVFGVLVMAAVAVGGALVVLAILLA